jgi:amidase
MADRFQQMGLVSFAKTNAAELGASSLTVPEAFGATRNPWNLDRNSGGSSGGSAAAVAARVVPMA